MDMLLRHYSRARVADVHSVEQRDMALSKPRGLWVSVDSCEHSWPEWCRSESFGLDRLAVVHDVRLAADANVLRLASAYEIDGFSDQYGRQRCPEYRDRDVVDWAAVARDYQGIIIAPYIWARRLDGGSSWYYGWDCASGCIWDARAIAAVEPIEIPDAA